MMKIHQVVSARTGLFFPKGRTILHVTPRDPISSQHHPNLKDSRTRHITICIYVYRYMYKYVYWLRVAVRAPLSCNKQGTPKLKMDLETANFELSSLRSRVLASRLRKRPLRVGPQQARSQLSFRCPESRSHSPTHLTHVCWGGRGYSWLQSASIWSPCCWTMRGLGS